MKKMTLKAVLCLTLTISALGSTCADQYGQAITKFENSKFRNASSNTHTLIHAVSAYGLVSLGAAVLPAYFAYPVVIKLIVANQKKLQFYTDLFSEGKASEQALEEIMAMLEKKGVSVEADLVKNELDYLNESGALCDGSIFKRKQNYGPRGNRKETAIKVPSKSMLVRHLKKTLK